jgi:uncharacterized protein (TIRG00374 family)
VKKEQTPWYRHTGLRVTASLVLLLVCFSLVDFSELVDVLVNVNPWYFLLALSLNAIGTVLIKAWIAHISTRASGLTLGFGNLIRINLIARFYTIVLPRGASAAVRWHYYKKGGSGPAAAALLVFENLVSIWTLFLSSAVLLIFEYQQGGVSAEILLPVSWIGLLVVTVILLPFLHKKSANLFRNLAQPFIKKQGWMSGVISKLIDAIASYQSLSTTRVGAIFFASFLGYAFFVLSAWILASGMEIGIGLAAIAWVRSITLIVALVPITIAGIGLRESMLITLLSGYGISASAAFAYAIASFAIQVVLGIVGGLLAAWGLLNKTDEEPVPGSSEKSS